MLTANAMRKRVRKGALFLDQQIGRDWPKKINQGILAMDSISSCMLGQLDSDYDLMKNKLGLKEIQATRLGFNLFPDESGLHAFHQLRECWVREINRRIPYIKEVLDVQQGGSV